MKNLLSLFLSLLLLIMTGACSMSEKSDNDGTDVDGQGGSLARFTVKGDYLYTVDISRLHTFSISNPEKPREVDSKSLEFYTETIFPYNNALLLGTDNGMYVFGLDNPASPVQKSFFQHIVSCDPVAAQNNYAYITLNSANTRCWRNANQLQIVDISNLSNPFLVKEYSMTSPQGLDIESDTLYVCENGLTVYDVQDKMNIREIKHFSDIAAKDIICLENSVIVIGSDGLHQYAFSGNDFIKLSSILVNQ